MWKAVILNIIKGYIEFVSLRADIVYAASLEVVYGDPLNSKLL